MIFLNGNLDTGLETAGKTKPVTPIMTPPIHHRLTRLISGSLELGYMDLRGAGKQLSLDLETIFPP